MEQLKRLWFVLWTLFLSEHTQVYSYEATASLGTVTPVFEAGSAPSAYRLGHGMYTVHVSRIMTETFTWVLGTL